MALSKKHDIPLVAANDCHYLEVDDHEAQEVLMCAQTKVTLSDEERMKFGSTEFNFKSPEEMKARFEDCPEAIENTLKIADLCHVELKWEDDEGKQIYHLPDFDIKTNESQEMFFRRLSQEGLEKRFQGPHFTNIIKKENWESEIRTVYEDRLKSELDMIAEMGFSGYFLIVADFIQWAKDKKISVGPGRGSGAGSIVAYALSITNINPIPFNLLFERFINPERISMPDFDVDFCQQRRGEVIDYVTEKYGKERVGQIVTFGKLQAKAAIRDVSRVFSLPYSEADMLSKLVPEELGITLEKALEVEPKFKELMDSDPKIKKIIEISKKVEGLNRHASIHAAGVIITSKPLVNYCPLFLGAKGEQVIQFDKNFSELIGLVKFDFLGLKTLTVIEYASAFIRQIHLESFDIEEIDLEDSLVYQFIGNGETVGVFQLESSGMIDLCKRIKPDTLDDITAINALYRPGPMESGMVDDFVDIKNGKKEPTFPFKELEPVLKDTLGVIVYQEQVMNIARIVAGYSLGQADMLRRAMGKKKVAEMERHKEIFRKGAIEKGFDEQVAVDLFEKMANFAAYGFNKSHAVAYALIAYQTAYLKYYYPACFFAGLLSTELNNTDKVTAYINDLKNYEIKILPPDVNESLWLFNVVEGNIRFAMGAVKNVGEAAVQEIKREREEKGHFKSFIDFCERCDLKIVNKRAVESLIKVGGFDQCEKMNRQSLLKCMEKVMSHGNKISEEKALGQVSLFDLGEGLLDIKKMLDIEAIDEFDEKEKLAFEYQLMGIYVSGHPLDRYAESLKEFSSMSLAQVQELSSESSSGHGGYSGGKGRFSKDRNKREVTLGGVLSSLKNIITKKGDKMCFATLEDLSGKIECIVFPRVFSEYEDILKTEDPVLMEGQVNLEETPKKFFPQKIEFLEEHSEERVNGVAVNIDLEILGGGDLERFKEIVMSFKGDIPIHLIFRSPEGRVRMFLGKDFLVRPSSKWVGKVHDIFGENCVRFITNNKMEEA
jgi:DNA polymerase-3 subunit alpha